VIKEAVVLLETSILRAADALQIAAAVAWGAEWFISADRRQLAAARRAGLRTKAV
jgi:predicted nucleic acid-binding protein